MADAPLVRSIEKTRARVDSLRVHPRNPRKISPARMEQLQRAMELSPAYCDVIRQRYADYTGQPELAP